MSVQSDFSANNDISLNKLMDVKGLANSNKESSFQDEILLLVPRTMRHAG